MKYWYARVCSSNARLLVHISYRTHNRHSTMDWEYAMEWKQDLLLYTSAYTGEFFIDSWLMIEYIRTRKIQIDMCSETRFSLLGHLVSLLQLLSQETVWSTELVFYMILYDTDRNCYQSFELCPAVISKVS